MSPPLIPTLLLCAVSVLAPGALSACVMSAVITQQGRTLDAIPPSGLPSEFTQYNDLWDYPCLVMASSSPETNDDGYGIVAYQDNDPQLRPQYTWHKRVTEVSGFGQTYYTGDYLAPDHTGPAAPKDTFDLALNALRDRSASASIALFHARSASGLTLGNHPFTFDCRDRTYSFMHNGFNSAGQFMISRIGQLYPDGDWFNRHPSNFFGDTDPNQWVDSELLFHYLICHIIDRQGDTLAGLNSALSYLWAHYPGTANLRINFILSDGEKLYALRSTPQTGTNSQYRLSYKHFPGLGYAVRTLSPAPGDTELQAWELVVLSRDQAPAHFPLFGLPDSNCLTAGGGQPAVRYKPLLGQPGAVISPNPFRDSASLRFSFSNATEIRAVICDAKGRQVWSWAGDYSSPSAHPLVWNGRDNQGRRVAAGVYFLTATSGNEHLTRKIILLK